MITTVALIFKEYFNVVVVHVPLISNDISYFKLNL